MSVKCAVVGLGIGALHVESLAKIPEAEIVAFADLDVTQVEKFAAKYGARAYTSWGAMLEGENELDAVILATPAHVRLEPIRAICERKIALFCEKPPAVNLEQALVIRDIIGAAGILNAVGFMYRWGSLADRVRELIAGRPPIFARGVVAWPIFDWVASGSAPKNLYTKAGCGGPLIEQGIHYQDVLRYITGDEPVVAQAMAELGNTQPLEGRDCEETTAYVLRHESGMLSTHVHNWSHKGTVMQIQIVGESYELTWDMHHNTLKFKNTSNGEELSETGRAEFYFDEMVGFIQAVQYRDQTNIRSSYADACKSLAVCEAVASAVLSNQSVPVS